MPLIRGHIALDVALVAHPLLDAGALVERAIALTWDGIETAIVAPRTYHAVQPAAPRSAAGMTPADVVRRDGWPAVLRILHRASYLGRDDPARTRAFVDAALEKSIVPSVAVVLEPLAGWVPAHLHVIELDLVDNPNEALDRAVADIHSRIEEQPW